MSVERKPLDPPSLDRDDFETQIEALQVATTCKPGFRCATQPSRLLNPDRLLWTAIAGSRPHLHLADDDQTATPQNEVELVPTGTDVRSQQPVAAQTVVSQHATLGVPTKPLTIGKAARRRPLDRLSQSRRRSRAPETSGGGRHSDREHARQPRARA